MKKLLTVLFAFALSFSLFGCAKEPYQEIEIDATELKEKMENNETFVFMVIRDNCPYCESLYEYIEVSKAEHPELVLYKIDCTDYGFKKNEDGTLNSSTEDGQYLLSLAPYFKYTPTLFRVEDGDIVVTGVGFDDSTNEVSLWPNSSIVDFTLANTQNYWDFISFK